MALWNLKPHKTKLSKPQSRPLRSLPPPKSLPADKPKPAPKPIQPPEPKPKITKKIYHPEKEFLATFHRFSGTRSPIEVWRDFIVMSACAISNSVDKTHFEEREKLYLNTINRYPKLEQQFFPELFACLVLALEREPNQDFLGKMYMTLNFGNDRAGQIFTPYDVSRIMAKLTEGDLSEQVKEKGYATICDTCCGAGSTLIAAVNEARDILEKEKLNYQNHILVTGQDIDMGVALMCYIQLSLLGLAGFVKVGNSLTDPITEKDSLENYWFTPMYFSKVWTLRRLFKNL